MKILLVNDYFLPGLGYEAGLAEAYMSLGHDVVFSASNRVPPEKSDLGASTDGTDIPYRLHTVLGIGNRHLLMPGLLLDLVRFRPNLVHTHTFLDLTSIMLAVLRPILRYKLVYSCHASHLNTDTDSSFLRRMAYSLWRGVGGRLIRWLADDVTAVGENERTLSAWALRMDPAKIRIVRLGADLNVFSDKLNIDRAAVRSGLGVDPTEPMLIHIGTLASRKEAEALITVSSELRRRGIPVNALIVGGGDGEYIQSLKSEIHLAGAENFIRLIDHFESRESVREYYASADIAVWPAEISIATIEAMASGLPIVLKSGDSYRDFLVSADNGLLYESGNLEDLADKIEMIVSDPDLRIRLGSSGRKFAEDEFSWQSIATGIVERSSALDR